MANTLGQFLVLTSRRTDEMNRRGPHADGDFFSNCKLDEVFSWPRTATLTLGRQPGFGAARNLAATWKGLAGKCETGGGATRS